MGEERSTFQRTKGVARGGPAEENTLISRKKKQRFMSQKGAHKTPTTQHGTTKERTELAGKDL